MPNTPCLIGQAASAYVLGSHATPEDNDKVFALMSSVGACTQPHLCTGNGGQKASGGWVAVRQQGGWLADTRPLLNALSTPCQENPANVVDPR